MRVIAGSAACDICFGKWSGRKPGSGYTATTIASFPADKKTSAQITWRCRKSAWWIRRLPCLSRRDVGLTQQPLVQAPEDGGHDGGADWNGPQSSSTG